MQINDIVSYSKEPNQLDIKGLLRRAQHAFSINQYQSAANDYFTILRRLAPQLASPSSQVGSAQNKEIYLRVQEWLCECYLLLDRPNEVLNELLTVGENINITTHYLRARAYSQLDKISEAITELRYCNDRQEVMQDDDDNTWMNSNLFLATLYIQNNDTSSGEKQLEFCKNTLEERLIKNSIDAVDYLNFTLEIQYHLCQIYRINNDIESAIQALTKAYQLYLPYKDIEDFADNEDITASAISVISQLFLLLMEKKDTKAALLLLSDLTLFEKGASTCETSAQAKALIALLLYAKCQYESGNHLKAANAFSTALPYIGAASKLENKTIVVNGLLFAAGFYLLPEYHNTEYTLTYAELAHKRLAELPTQKQDIVHLELLLLKLAALQYQNDVPKSTDCFKKLMELYVVTNQKSREKCIEILSSTLTLFPTSTLDVFRNQVIELQKHRLDALSQALSVEKQKYDIPENKKPILNFNQMANKLNIPNEDSNKKNPSLKFELRQ